MGKLCNNNNWLAGRLVAIAAVFIGIAMALPTMAQADNTPVQQLVTSSHGHSQDEIDDTEAQTRSDLVEVEAIKTTLTRWNNLLKLFVSQIATLRDRRVPEQIVEKLESQREEVIAKALGMTIGDGNIPFLPVIPISFRSPYDLMAMVRNGNRVGGYNHLNSTQIYDVVDTPKEPYYIYDVEDGNATRGISPFEAQKLLKKQLRSPLTAAEVMALAAHTDVLSQHYVWAAGSRFESTEEVPIVYLSTIENNPGLNWGLDYTWDDYLGSASCGSR